MLAHSKIYWRIFGSPGYRSASAAETFFVRRTALTPQCTHTHILSNTHKINLQIYRRIEIISNAKEDIAGLPWSCGWRELSVRAEGKVAEVGIVFGVFLAKPPFKSLAFRQFWIFSSCTFLNAAFFVYVFHIFFFQSGYFMVHWCGCCVCCAFCVLYCANMVFAYSILHNAIDCIDMENMFRRASQSLLTASSLV